MSNPVESRRDGPATRHIRFKEVLLIDEDETWGLALQDALSAGGYRVHLAVSLYDTVREVRKKLPDLMVISALLGNHVSESLLREIEGISLPPPVLLVGARTGEVRWEAWKSLPCLSTVPQPFKLTDVLEAASALLGSPWEDLTGEGDVSGPA
jgi:DNA-binding response OmpR family regulator